MIAVGIDVSKSKSTVAILNSDGEILAKPYDIHHVESDIDNLITYLHSLHDDIKIVMEATGHYHLPVLKKLHNADLFICVMNPYLMKKYGDNEIRRGKTDKKDAMRMAFYALEKSYALTRYSTLDQKYLDLKFLSRQYNQRVSTKIKNRVYLGNLLDETMPGIENILMSKIKISILLNLWGKRGFSIVMPNWLKSSVAGAIKEKLYRFMSLPVTVLLLVALITTLCYL